MVIDVQITSLFTAVALIIIGIFAAAFLDNLIKKIIGLAFIGDGVNLFLIAMGYKPGGIVYIYLPGMAAEWFSQNAAYPLTICNGFNQHCDWSQYHGSDAGNYHRTLQKARIFKRKGDSGRVIKCHFMIPTKSTIYITMVQEGYCEPLNTPDGYCSHTVCTVSKPFT